MNDKDNWNWSNDKLNVFIFLIINALVNAIVNRKFDGMKAALISLVISVLMFVGYFGIRRLLKKRM